MRAPILSIALAIAVVIAVFPAIMKAQTEHIYQVCREHPTQVVEGEITVNCTEWIQKRNITVEEKPDSSIKGGTGK